MRTLALVVALTFAGCGASATITAKHRPDGKVLVCVEVDRKVVAEKLKAGEERPE